jgi:exosome complex RNA-binding protein Rrp42 (RNase PH superfamily)
MYAYCYSSKLTCCHSLSHRNLIDTANIATLAALSTFRRPECTVGGEDGQQVTVHDPEVGINLQCIVLYGLALLLKYSKKFNPSFKA